MDIGENPKLGSDSQDSDDVQAKNKQQPSLQPTSLGVQNAKKRLRAFSIQKKTSLSPVSIPKPVSSGSATVFIGKLTSAKMISKPVEDPDKKLPKPPKPGANRQHQESYMRLRQNTLSEIEDMKRKMELVELGIPLGLICPAPNSDKAMPTKAMPPIKSFLARNIRIYHPVKAIKKPPTCKKETPPDNPAQVDEIIREAKKAKAEGKEFKFNYNKLLPDYDNPFQRKKDELEKKNDDHRAQTPGRDKHSKRSDKYDPKRHHYKKSDEKESYRDRRKPKEREERPRDKDNRSKDKEDKSKDRDDKKTYERSKSKSSELKKEEPRKEESNKEQNLDTKEPKTDCTKAQSEVYKDNTTLKETDVDLKDFLVCDSWSLDNEDKSKDASPKSLPREEVKEQTPPKFIDPMEQLRHSLTKKDVVQSPVNKLKIEKLQPVIDSFKFEIEEDDMLDMFDENSSTEKFAQTHKSKPSSSPLYEFESKDVSMDDMADDTFLESVINEIKAEEMDESSQDKGLVEYESPNRESVTPELDSSRSSRRSDYSDGFKSIESYKSTESGYKSTESGYKSTDSGYKITEPYRHSEEVYKSAEGYRSPERSYKCPEKPYKNTSESYSTPERPYKSSERSYNSQERSYKSDRSYGSPDRRYVSSERSYSSLERSYRSSERSYDSLERYKSQEKGYQSPERQYKSLERNYKSTDLRYKSNDRSYSSPDIAYKQTDKNYKYTETGYKSPENAYNMPERCYKSPERIYRSPEMGYKSNESYKSDRGYNRSPQMAYKSVERGYKSPDVSYKLSERDYKMSDVTYKSETAPQSDRYESRSSDLQHKSEASKQEEDSRKITRSMMDSLETWDFVLKVCQPLLFRHDRNRCYKETRVTPKVWFNENPKLCDCIKDRTTVYEELEMTKMELVDTVYSCDQVREASFPTARGWYPSANQCLVEHSQVELSSEWEADDSQLEGSATPQRNVEVALDREYHRFMKSVWPDVETKSETPRSTPLRETKKRDDGAHPEERRKKAKLSSEGWSQESDFDDVGEKSKKNKVVKEKRKRKRSSSTVSEAEVESKKRKKLLKKKDAKKSKEKSSKRLSRKALKKLKEKHKKKKKVIRIDESDEERNKKEKKKRDKKAKKKKQLKQKKKNLKKKKSRKRSPSTSSTSESTDSEFDKKTQKKKRKQSSSESTQEDLFDVNILNNIKTERLTDDEKIVRPKPREIIDVKELQNDFVGKSIQIKKEVEQEEQTDEKEVEHEAKEDQETKEAEQEVKDVEQEVKEVEQEVKEVEQEVKEVEQEVKGVEQEVKEVELKIEEVSVEVLEVSEDKSESQESQATETVKEIDLADIKIPDDPPPTPQLKLPEESTSQSSSSSIQSNKGPVYEKDESYLRPSSQNSNYSFQDVIQSREQHHIIITMIWCCSDNGAGSWPKELRNVKYFEATKEQYTAKLSTTTPSSSDVAEKKEELEDQHEDYEGNYEMYEQMAMEYQSDVASQRTSPPCTFESQRIETVVRVRSCGEIKCDWRPGDRADTHYTPQRPSRWGLKPSEVNIVLTGGSEQFPIQTVVEPVYKIQSIANRTENSNTGYDEAYQDMYGASDKLQYGDCFNSEEKPPEPKRTSTLDDRIDQALRSSVLGEVAKDNQQEDKEKDKGILVSKPAPIPEPRSVKRVSFADGYKPGQDSDVEEPPIKKKKKVRRYGCAWPCPASHPDHVPLWDALPPPPPPPGSPPPPLRAPAAPGPGVAPLALLQPPHHLTKFDPNLPFMPPEPPPGMINF